MEIKAPKKVGKYFGIYKLVHSENIEFGQTCLVTLTVVSKVINNEVN